MLGRPRKTKRVNSCRAYYFDHPLDFDKPIPVEVNCLKCKKLMFHFEIARDATVVIFCSKCPNCTKRWRVKVRPSLKVELTPDEVDEV